MLRIVKVYLAYIFEVNKKKSSIKHIKTHKSEIKKSERCYYFRKQRKLKV